jgi:hypothetical protein
VLNIVICAKIILMRPGIVIINIRHLLSSLIITAQLQRVINRHSDGVRP